MGTSASDQAVCDFCGSADLAASFPCTKHILLSRLPNGCEVVSNDAWAACAACAGIIYTFQASLCPREAAAASLAHRSISRFTLTIGMPIYLHLAYVFMQLLPALGQPTTPAQSTLGVIETAYDSRLVSKMNTQG